MIHHTKALVETQSMAMNLKMPRWQWFKSCFVCRMKVAGATNAAHHVENSASVLQHQGLLHISIWNVFQLSIDQDGWKMLSFHFCMKSLNNGKTLSSIWEPLMIFKFSRKPSVYIAMIYPNLLHKCRTGSLIAVILAHTFCNHQAGLGEFHDFISCYYEAFRIWHGLVNFYVISLVGKLCKSFGSWSGLSRYCFPLLQPRTALWVSWWSEVAFWKVKTMILGDFWSKFFKSKGSSLFSFPRRPDLRHRKWLGGVYLFGTDGCGHTSVGSSFWDKMRYIND